MAKFVKGKSGNPGGRPKGSVNHRKIREAILNEAPKIVNVMIEQAKSGDTTAARVLLDRVIAPMKAGDTFVNLPLTGKLSEDARGVLFAIGSSSITPGQGQSILQSIASITRIIEIDDLINRVEKLESKNDHPEEKNRFPGKH